MTHAPELTSASDLTSADYLAGRVKQAYLRLGLENLEEIKSLYTDDVYFEDPSHGVQGKAALEKYFTNQFQNLQDCSFKFHQTITNGSDIFMAWTMFLKHPRLNSGGIIRVEGASYLKTRNGKIYYHRDYFDLGALVYENVPILGRIVSKIKRRLGQ
ncbi:MAG: transcriptional regulator [Gammaproteobacteria bacterium]|nr:transcriptional regulator [Gammaproteobacteria bacterium]|tara:strand:+ start:783 stop:1253 length:471 start_codon:yes stop_codon:yes gene_type:complete